MKICSWSAGISRRQMTLLHTPDVRRLRPRAWGSGNVGHILTEFLSCISDCFHKHESKKPPLCGVPRSLLLSLALPQIKISVIKLIKVMHANMPLGSRPDFIQHTDVESCTSFTFDVAFFMIENNWIPSPHPIPPIASHAHKHTVFAHVHSGHALLIDLLWGGAGCWVSVASGGFLGGASAERSPSCVWEKRQIWNSPGSVLRDGTSTRVRGRSAGWTGACHEWEPWDLWEQWQSLLGLCCSTSISAWPSIWKEPLWPTGSWLLSTLSGTADNQQKETPDDYSAAA